MKKIATALGIVLVLIVAAAAAAPFWLGMQAEKAYTETVQELSKNTGVAFDLRRYERGWLRSSAEGVLAWPGLPTDLTVTHDIVHGPISIDRLLAGDLSFNPALAFISSRATFSPGRGASDTAKALARQLPPMTAEAVVNLAGDIEIEMKMPPARKIEGVNWRGLSATMNIRGGGTQLTANLHSPGLAIESPTGEVAISQIRANSDLSGGRAGYMFGTNTLHIGSIAIGPDIELKGVRLTTAAKPAGAAVDTTINYLVKELRANNASYGPGQLTLALRNLDAGALRRFEQQVNTISKRNLPQEQASMMVAAETMKLIGALSKKAPELEVTKLSFTTPEGELSGTAKLVLDGSKLDLAQDMMLIVRALQGELELSVPPSMVKAILTPQIREDIEGYKRTGALSSEEAQRITPAVMAKIVERAYPSYLQRNPFTRMLAPAGSYYRLTVSFRSGRLLINNQPVRQPLGMLQSSRSQTDARSAS